jgi:hypothetical protein
LYPNLFKITAVCDPLKERRDMAVARYPLVRSYRRYEDLLADSEVELIVIATRSDDHAQMAMQALKLALAMLAMFITALLGWPGATNTAVGREPSVHENSPKSVRTRLRSFLWIG